MIGCNPVKWLWGLIPVLLVALLVVAGEGPKIERDLVRQANAILDENGHDWATVSFSGRDAVLTGTAFSPGERTAAVDAVKGVFGVASVQDRAELLPGISPYTWWATREDGTIKIKGHVPSEADRQTILGIVKATMPDLAIDDRMKLASGTPSKQRWLGAISFALNQLGPLKKGSARLSDMELDLSGEAGSEASYRAIFNALGAQLPEGLSIVQVNVTPPVIKPYVWGVKFKDGKVTLSGHVPSDALRQEILEGVRQAFAGVVIEDGMMLGSGEPEGWPGVVSLVISQLSRLEEGEVAVEGLRLSIKGTAADEATSADVVKTVRGSLPASFKSEEDVRSRKAEEPVERPKARPGGKPEKTMAQPPHGRPVLPWILYAPPAGDLTQLALDPSIAPTARNGRW